MLVASQVLLSIVLPTVIFPLVYLCSRKDIMHVEGPEVEDVSRPAVTESAHSGEVEEAQPRERRKKTYDSPRWVTALGYALFGIVIIANVYVIVELALGND